MNLVQKQSQTLLHKQKLGHDDDAGGSMPGTSSRSVASRQEPPAAASGSSRYYWPHARGHPGSYSVTQYTAPQDLNASLRWFWQHEDGRYHTTVIGVPLLDDRENIYLASEDGIRKFSPDGQVLWHYKPPASMVSSASLMDGALYGNSQDGHAFALDMESGKAIWIKKYATETGGDTAYVEALDGIVVTAMGRAKLDGGNKKVMGLNATNGEKVWDYVPEVGVWNFMPVFPGDGSLVFMDWTGGVYRLDLQTGTELWHTTPPAKSINSFTDGGVILGPDGTAYTCSNLKDRGSEGTAGVLRAYHLGNGSHFWAKHLEYPCNSWPAVAGDTVVVATGPFVSLPPTAPWLWAVPSVQKGIHQVSQTLGSSQRSFNGHNNLPAAVIAFNARTGEQLWRYELPHYGREAAAGDEEGILVRTRLGIRAFCLPAQWNSPTISGDGTVYLGRASGMLYGIRAMEDGHVEEASKFNAHSGFLHPGTAWGPSTMAVATCDRLYVFRTTQGQQ